MATFWLRATRHLLELGFTESDAFETEQLANVSVAVTLALLGCLIHWTNIAFIIGFRGHSIVFWNNMSVVSDAVSVFAA